jgi:hypothetical protein
VNVSEATKVNIHAVLLKIASGQLPFLGLSAGQTLIMRADRMKRKVSAQRPKCRRLQAKPGKAASQTLTGCGARD